MNTLKKILLAAATVIGLQAAPLQASGLLTPAGSADSLELKSHHVEVSIEDSFATTAIEQEFRNPHNYELEALYTFPVPKDAVVGEFIHWIDGQPVIAEAVEKQQAREVYEQQKQAGQATALVEQDSYRRFEMRVFPVPAGDSVKVRLVYLQNALLDHGVGRYVYPMQEGGVDVQQQSFWTRNDTVEQDFSFEVKLHSGYPVESIRLPAHPQALQRQDTDGNWSASFGNEALEETQQQQPQKFRLDKDVVVYWRLSEGLPGRLDLSAYRQPENNSSGTFKLTYTPGEDLALIKGRRNWVFVLDNSGSMEGKYNSVIEGLRQGLNKLPTQDYFQLITFNSRSQDLSGGYRQATAKNVNAVMDKVITAGTTGGTNLYDGLQRGLRKLDADIPTGVFLVTDGVANVGPTERKDFYKLLKKYDVRLFTFIMGNSANEPLLQGMADLSNGFAANISNSDDMLGQVMSAASKVKYQSLNNIRLKFNGTSVFDVSPDAPATLYRGEQLTMMGHYNKGGKVKVTLTADVGAEHIQRETEITLPEADALNPQLERLWALSKIKGIETRDNYLGEEGSESKAAITDLSLQYGLLTEYTSLLVVKEQVFAQHGIERKNKQRVEREQQARQQRANQTVAASPRADAAKPISQRPAATHRSSGSNGGGSADWLFLVALSLIALPRLRKKS